MRATPARVGETMREKLIITVLLLAMFVAAVPLACAGDLAAEVSSLPAAPSALITAVPEPILPAPALAYVSEAPKRKTFDRNFALVSLLAAGLMIADIELTQHCQDNRTCIEMNPLVPRSRAAKYASAGSFNGMLFYWSFRRKESGKKLWWLAPMLVIGAHGAGTADNVRFAR
jgi:hypothetical protein